MGRMHRLIVLTAAIAAFSQSVARAQGVEPTELSDALSVLPEVSLFELDGGHHVTVLEGWLTPFGPSAERDVARAFVTIHRSVFPAARNSEFHVESVARSGDQATVMLRQSVAGFAAQNERLEMGFRRGRLVSVRGVVLHSGDVPPVDRVPMVMERALEIALHRSDPRFEVLSASASRILHGEDHHRSWRVEMMLRTADGYILETVVVDALDETVLAHESAPLNHAVPSAAPADPTTSMIGGDGCEPAVPPVGEFMNLRGQSLWHGADTGCGRWEFDPKLTASLFHGNCMDYVCHPFPSTEECDHGEIRRDGLILDTGLEGVRLEFLTPDHPIFMRLRWGPGRDRAIPFVITSGPETTTEIELDLSRYTTWDAASVSGLILELVHDEQILIRSMDLYPGPWLEFSRGPVLDREIAGGELIEGEPVAVLQDVRNAGCRLAAGTHRDMRTVDYLLYRRSGLSWDFEGYACEGAQIPGSFAPEASVRALPICGFVLPRAGTWRLEAAFRNHPAAAVRTRFVVEAAQHPDLSIDSTTPIDLYSGNLGSWPCRSDLLDLSRFDDPEPECGLPWVVAVPVSAQGSGTVTSSVTVWGRTRDPAGSEGYCDPTSIGWLALGEPRQWTFHEGTQVVDVPLDRGHLEAVALVDDGWSLLDLKVTVAPVMNEQDLEDNAICLPAWVAMADGALEEVMGPTWLADDYFLDPQHWPPHGLVWTGVTLDHEEGATSWDPDSALLSMSVDGSSNEDPRVIWYEDRPDAAVSGLLIRYRRTHAGFGDGPFLDAGAEEADGIPAFDIVPEGHENRAGLTADSQWRTLVWRRDANGPFGEFPVPILESPASSGDTLSLHLAPDRNCLVNEPGCPSDIHPATLIDVVGGWHVTDLPSPEPFFVAAGLRLWRFGQWVPVPSQLVSGEDYEFAVEVRNVGAVSGVADLYAAVEILVAGESSPMHTMTGSEIVTIPANGSYDLPLDPGWTPVSPGVRRMLGAVSETGQLLDEIDVVVEVIDDGSGCPVPVVDLP